MTEILDTIYLFGYSPRDSSHLDTIIPLIKNQNSKGTKIGIVLIHDGVIGASSKGKVPKEFRELVEISTNIYVLTPDLKARGIALDTIDSDIKAIEYREFVDIIDSSEKIISWI